MDEIEPRHRRDALRIVGVVVVALLALIPLVLVRQDVWPLWVFVGYAVVAMGYAVVTLPSAVRSILRGRPANTGERYWTLD